MRPTTVYERTDAPTAIEVRSSAFEAGANIPHSHAGDGSSPPLAWSGIPPSARSLLLIVEDPDARGSTPYVHWLVYAIPADTKGLPASIPNLPRLGDPPGAVQGKNSAGTIGYTPPHPPRQDPPHAYHFELFALDTTLSLPAGITREQVMAAASGHIVAKGELVGFYGRR